MTDNIPHRIKVTTLDEHMLAMQAAKDKLDNAGKTYRALYEYACTLVDLSTDLVEMYGNERLRSFELREMLQRSEWR